MSGSRSDQHIFKADLIAWPIEERKHICIKITSGSTRRDLGLFLFSVQFLWFVSLRPIQYGGLLLLLHAWQKGYDTQIHDCWLLIICYNHCNAAACGGIPVQAFLLHVLNTLSASLRRSGPTKKAVLKMSFQKILVNVSAVFAPARVTRYLF